ncbi:MAG: aspartyl protease family protein [Chloroflexota bacterium]
MPQPTVLLDVPIRFDVGDTVTHAPMIDVIVGGQPTRLILDTGSTDHVLTIDLVRAAGLQHAPGEPGTDHAGASVDSWFVGEAPAAIEDMSLTLHDVVAITGPAPFGGWGVGGFLSPQHLRATAWTVLDLRADRLVLLEGDDADILEWLRKRTPDLAVLQLPRDVSEATPVVQAAIEPFAAVATMLNTGGRGTEFAASAVPGLVGAPELEPGKGVGGSSVLGEVVELQMLLVGGARFAVPRLLVRETIDTMHGLVGMDLLHGTVLVVSADRTRPLFWMVTPGPD